MKSIINAYTLDEAVNICTCVRHCFECIIVFFLFLEQQAASRNRHRNRWSR